MARKRETLIMDNKKSYEINSAEYDGKEQTVIDFKDGKRIRLDQVENLLKKNKSAPEPTLGKETSKTIMNYLKNNNPTKAEFLKHFSSIALNKGGLIDYRKTGLFK